METAYTVLVGVSALVWLVTAFEAGVLNRPMNRWQATLGSLALALFMGASALQGWG